MQPCETIVTKTASLIESFWDASFLKAPGPLRSQEEEFGGSTRTSQEKEEAEGVANESRCMHVLTDGQNNDKESGGSVPFVSSDHIEHVFWFGSCHANISLQSNRSIFAEKLFQTQTPSLGPLAPPLQEWMMNPGVSGLRLRLPIRSPLGG